MPAIIGLGGATSYEDLRYGRISNKWVVLGLAYSFFMYIILIAYYSMNSRISGTYLIELATNFIFALAVGFGLWYIRVWTAGDGKLFIAYAALLPLSVYTKGYQKYIPCFVFLTNIFISAAAIMVFYVLFKAGLRKCAQVALTFIREFFKLKNLLESAISLFAIYWIIDILFHFLQLGNNLVLRISFTIFAFSAVRAKFGPNTVYATAVISVFRLFFDDSVFSVGFLTNFLFLIFVWRLFRSLVRGSLSKLAEDIFSKDVPVDKLEEGMVLGEILRETRGGSQTINYGGKAYEKTSKNFLDLENFLDEEPEGLTKRQIMKLKNMGIKEIKVSQTIAFAPFIFLGAILTLIAKGNILIFIRNLFQL